MTSPESAPSLLARNYTETRRIDRRLYQIGDMRLPFAPTFKAIGFALAFLAIELLVYRIIGFEFTADRIWYYVLPPPILAMFAANLRLQGKSFGAFLAAQLRFMGHLGRSWGAGTAKHVRVVIVLWEPTASAYRSDREEVAA